MTCYDVGMGISPSFACGEKTIWFLSNGMLPKINNQDARTAGTR